ncbi:hypothetical protein [Embleya sp. NPDC005971]|uniref:hypothetical protein n=1 Tax=Embleya sp. NPDC005971 TaxID=3156724 RepID=UPI003408BDCF
MSYTDNDLYAEAARQHHEATEDPDYVGIGERMAGETIGNTDTKWGDLDIDEFSLARTGIDELIRDAADTSRWAIDLGADDLEPHERTFTFTGDGGRNLVRLHFAFAQETSPEERNSALDAFVEELHMNPFVSPLDGEEDPRGYAAYAASLDDEDKAVAQTMRARRRVVDDAE